MTKHKIFSLLSNIALAFGGVGIVHASNAWTQSCTVPGNPIFLSVLAGAGFILGGIFAAERDANKP